MSAPEGILLRLYRSLNRRVVEPFFLRRLVSSPRLVPGAIVRPPVLNLATNVGPVPRVWFHGASAGEIETIAEIITGIVEQWDGVEVVLTVFSQSGIGNLTDLKRSLGELGANLIYSGFCPWEGYWLPALTDYRPDLFVTAKYEAWPDLWASAAALEIPIAIVSAKARRSLSVARHLLRLMGPSLPELIFGVNSAEEVRPLRDLFPHARIEVTGDPRWDRVLRRARQFDASSGFLSPDIGGLKPWVVLGSVWLQDIEFTGELLAEVSRSHVIWVVPHKVDEKNLVAIQVQLENWGLHPVRLSAILPTSEAECILVDSLGRLPELYGRARWAYVGGGFGSGIHSLLEPAVYGVSIACGSIGVDSIDLAELLATGQVTVVTSIEAFRDWSENVKNLESMCAFWKHQAQERQGASQRIINVLAARLGLTDSEESAVLRLRATDPGMTPEVEPSDWSGQ